MLLIWIIGATVLKTFSVYVVCLGLTVYSFSINEIARAKFQFDEKFHLFNFLVVFRPLFLLLVFALLLLKLDQIISDKAIVYYTIVMAFSSVLFSSIYFIKGGQLKPIPKGFPVKEYIAYGSKSILNRLLSLTLYAISIYMVSWKGNPEYVAYFFVANSISKVAWVIPDSAGNILYPQFIKADDDERKDRALKNMYSYAQLVFLLNILILVVFVLLGSWVIGLLYEESYHEAFLPTIILLVGNQGMVYYKLFSRWHASQNNWKYIYIATVFGVLVNVVLNFFLIPKMGIMGAAIATGCSFWICGIIISRPISGAFGAFLNVYSLFKNRCRVINK